MKKTSGKSLKGYLIREIRFETKFNATTSVNLDAAESGYYIVKITSTDGRQCVKTIVVN